MLLIGDGAVDSSLGNHQPMKGTVSVRHIWVMSTQTTIVVVMCHALGAITQPVCRERDRCQGRPADAGVFPLAAGAGGVETAFDLPRRAMDLSRIKCVPGDANVPIDRT